MVYNDCSFPPLIAYACLAVGVASAVLAGVTAYRTRPKRHQPTSSAAGWAAPTTKAPPSTRMKPRILVHDDKRDWAAERDERE